MDLQMPGMNGLELTRLIKAQPGNADIKVRRAHWVCNGG